MTFFRVKRFANSIRAFFAHWVHLHRCNLFFILLLLFWRNFIRLRPTCPGTKSVGGSDPWTMRPLVGCAVFATVFYSLRSESKWIWILFASYSHVLVYSLTLFIRIIRFIFASKYSHKFVYKYSIWCKMNTFSHTGDHLLQNIGFEAIIRKTWNEFHIQANIRLERNILFRFY